MVGGNLENRSLYSSFLVCGKWKESATIFQHPKAAPLIKLLMKNNLWRINWEHFCSVKFHQIRITVPSRYLEYSISWTCRYFEQIRRSLGHLLFVFLKIISLYRTSRFLELNFESLDRVSLVIFNFSSNSQQCSFNLA